MPVADAADHSRRRRYAVWSGAGIVLIAPVGYFAFDQALDAAALVGMALVVTGVLVIHLFSRTTA